MKWQTFLLSKALCSQGSEIVSEPPEELEKELRRPIKKLKKLVRHGAMTEQFESLISSCSSVEDQVSTAYEIAQSWALPVPSCVSALLEK